MVINNEIRAFSDFLNSCWDIVIPLLLGRPYSSDEGSIGDWLQVNWEILVEKKVLHQDEYLEIYGDGADFYGASSRMTDIEASPTFSIKVVLNNEGIIDLLNNELISNLEFAFDRLVGFKDGFYINAPPFNYVLIQDDSMGIERVLPLRSVKFELKLL
jgi:hypothetical protein